MLGAYENSDIPPKIVFDKIPNILFLLSTIDPNICVPLTMLFPHIVTVLYVLLFHVWIPQMPFCLSV